MTMIAPNYGRPRNQILDVVLEFHSMHRRDVLPPQPFWIVTLWQHAIGWTATMLIVNGQERVRLDHHQNRDAVNYPRHSIRPRDGRISALIIGGKQIVQDRLMDLVKTGAIGLKLMNTWTAVNWNRRRPQRLDAVLEIPILQRLDVSRMKLKSNVIA